MECKGPYFGAEIDMQCTSTCRPFFSLVHEDLGLAYPDSPAVLTASLKAFERGFIISGIAEFGEEKVEFGFDIEELFSFKDFANGWFRSESLSTAVYGPCIQWALPDTTLTGELDLFGTFDRAQLQCYIKGNGIEVTHPKLQVAIQELGEKDPLLLNTDGRALITYDFSKDHWMGTVPLKGATCLKKGTISSSRTLAPISILTEARSMWKI